MIKRLLLLLIIIATIPCLLIAQDSVWTLQRCVDYAMQNNISVQQGDVQSRLDALQTRLINAGSIPTIGFNTQAGYQFGRNIDPTSNQYINNNVFFQSYGLQANITLFNWFSLKNNRLAAATTEEASRLDVSRIKNDVGLNVVAAYLQVITAIEQMNISRAQIALTDSQLVLTRKQVEAGSMPELNAAQLESQLATDSSNYITAEGTMQQNRLQLIALLNLDASQPFAVSVPDVNKIPIPPLGELDPAALYQIALNTQPQQQVNTLRVKAAEYSVKSAKGAMYPTVSAFGSIGSQYSNTYRQSTFDAGSTFDTLGIVIVGPDTFPTLQPAYVQSSSKIPYFKQVGNLNLNQSVGIQLNVPILNGRQLRTNYERAKVNVDNYRLQQALDNQTLQQNIYTARTNAETAIQTYNANSKAADYSQYAYDLSKKRYDIGILSTSDYLIVQNNLATAKLRQVSARYDYIFRIKLLEFYKYGKVQL